MTVGPAVGKLIAVGSVIAAGAIAVAPAVVADTVLTVGGTGSALVGDQGSWRLPYTHGAPEVNIVYPSSPVFMDWSVAHGAGSLHAAIVSTPEGKTTVGISQGGLVLAEVKRRLMALPESDRPASGELVFIGVGDPSNPQGGLLRHFPEGFRLPGFGVTVVKTPETPWNTIYITREYDGFADFPDRVHNLVAVANALVGIVYVHAQPGYASVDLEAVPDRDVTVTTNTLGGVTTSYLVRTERLPLLQPARDLGVPEKIVKHLEAALKPVVDAGYVRNDPPRTPALTAASAPEPVAASVEPEPEPERKRHLRVASPGRIAVGGPAKGRHARVVEAELRDPRDDERPDVRTQASTPESAAHAGAKSDPAGDNPSDNSGADAERGDE